MKQVDYKANGVCAVAVHVTLDDNNIVENVVFDGGCMGNHLGIAALCKGMNAADVVARLDGIRCGVRRTSCPDQLAQALKTVL